MKRNYSSRIAFVTLFLAVSFVTLDGALAQNAPPVSDTVFPLGGLPFGITNDPTLWNANLPSLGLNSMFGPGAGNTISGLNAGLTGYPSIDGVVGNGVWDNTMAGGDATHTIQNVPGSTYNLGYNRLGIWVNNFTDYDFFLASNEPAESAWDLANGWNPPSYNSSITYSNGARVAFNNTIWSSTINGNQGNTPGTNSDWVQPTPSLVKTGEPITNNLSGNEWFIPTSADQGTDIYLNATDVPNGSSDGLHGNFTDGGTTGYIDFIYRLDLAVDYNGVDPSTGIYKIAFTVNFSDGTSFGPGIDVIHIADYMNYNDATENVNIRTFPNLQISGVAPSGQDNYAVYRIPISLSMHSLPVPDSISVSINSVDFQLVKLFDENNTPTSGGIFVRGVRIRSQHTDWLLRGMLDNDITNATSLSPNSPYPFVYPGLTSAFQASENDLIAGGGAAAWNKLIGAKAGNELGTALWRAYAHINQAFRNWTANPAHGGNQKNLDFLNLGPYQWWNAIYEDETATSTNPVGSFSPPLQGEQIPGGENSVYGFIVGSFEGYNDGWAGRPDHDFSPRGQYFTGGTTWSAASDFNLVDGNPTFTGLLFPGDAIPSAVKNHSLFDELGLSITGWNNTTYNKTFLSGGTNGTANDGNDYATYTTRFGNVTASSNQDEYYYAAHGCYPQNLPVSTWTSFWGYPSTFSAAHPFACYPLIEAGSNGMRATLYHDLKSAVNNPPNPLPPTIEYSDLNEMVSTAPTWNSSTFYELGQWVNWTQTGCSSSTPYAIWVCVSPCVGQAPSCSSNTFWHPIPMTLLSYFGLGIQTPTKWEIREGTWDALTWGAKGIMYNPIGNDGVENRGLCSSTFEHDINSGFSDVGADGSASYAEFTNFSFLPPDRVIPPMTNHDYQNEGSVHTLSSTQRFPDHWVHYVGSEANCPNSNCPKLWVPCISDFTIWNSSVQNSSTLVLSAGDNVTSTMIDAYIRGVQQSNGWTSTPSTALLTQNSLMLADLTAYYANLPTNPSGPGSPYWVAEATGGSPAQNPDAPPGISDWLAFDRNLDNSYNSSWSTAEVWSDNAASTTNKNVYDGWPKTGCSGCYWGDAPISYPGTWFVCSITGVPTYYGVKDKADGVIRATADIAPIAWELKKLRWVTSYTYSDLNNTSSSNDVWASGVTSSGAANMDGLHPSGDPEFPFKVTIGGSEQVKESGADSYTFGAQNPFVSSGNSDPSNEMFYNIGVFYDLNDPGAFYTTIANKRTWPMLLDWEHNLDAHNNPTQIRAVDSSTESLPTHQQIPLLGAIDARRIDLQLKVNTTSGGIAWQDYKGTTINWPNPPSGTPPVNWYTITNLRTGFDTTGQTDNPKTFSLDLEPGEGTLLRVAPATAIDLGRTSYMGMGYNNGHRVAEVHLEQVPLQSSGGCPPQPTFRGVCWESNGSIQFQLCPPSTSSENTDFANPPIPPATGTITIYSPPTPCSNCTCPTTSAGPWPAHSQDGHNPSIASKSAYVGGSGLNDTIGIVFSIDDYPARCSNSRSVVFYWSTGTDIGTTWQGPVTISPSGLQYVTTGVPDVTGVGSDGQYSDLLVPTISPAKSGFAGVYTAYLSGSTTSVGVPFWIHVSTASGTPTWVVSTSTSIPPIPQLPLPPFQAPSGGNVRFATVATNDDPSNQTSSGGLFSEIFHFAWESDFSNGSSGIYYQAIEHTWPGDGFSAPGPVTPVSDGYPLLNPVWVGPGTGSPMPSPPCPHHHPMIAVINRYPSNAMVGMPAITWEVTDEVGVITNSLNYFTGWEYVTGPTKPIEREAHQFSNLTPSWGSFFTIQALETGNLPQPVLRYEDNMCSGIPSSNFRELVFQDTFGREAFVYRKNQRANAASSWTANRLEDYAQTPSLSLPYELDPSADLGSISYREIYPDQNNLYAAMLVANPPAEEPVSKNLVQYIAIANANNPPCGLAAVSIGIGPGWKWNGPPAYGTNPTGNPTGNLSGPPVAPWNFQTVGVFTPVVSGGSTELVQSSWPLTEDSVRTSNFSVTTPDSITISRVLVVDTSQIAALLPDATHYISYKLVVKDSASQTVTQVLDSVLIPGGVLSGGSSYPGVNPNDTSMMGMGYNIKAIILPTPSGSAYVTAIITKDNSTQAELIQDEEYADSVAFQVPVVDSSSDSSGGPGYKPLTPTTLSTANTPPLVVTVHPNPVKGLVKICVEDIPGGIPAQVDVVDQLGHLVAMLYNATPDAESGLCLSLDCTTLPSGIYYADLQTMGMHQAVKFSVEH